MAFADFDVDEIFAEAQGRVSISEEVAAFGEMKLGRDGITDVRGFSSGTTANRGKRVDVYADAYTKRADRVTRDWIAAAELKIRAVERAERMVQRQADAIARRESKLQRASAYAYEVIRRREERRLRKEQAVAEAHAIRAERRRKREARLLEQQRRREAWLSAVRSRRKLLASDAFALRMMKKQGISGYKLAQQFGISQPMVMQIVQGTVYRDAGGPIWWPELGWIASAEEGRRRIMGLD